MRGGNGPPQPHTISLTFSKWVLEFFSLGFFFVFRTLLETLGGRGYVENLSSIVDNFNEKKPDVNLETPV